ncbi:MAG: methyltransferase domain-containing protein [Segetibacter sp.]
MKLSTRSYQLELLDQPSIPFADIKQNMNELDFINTWLGGHQITIDGFSQLVGDRKEISVCEIGCGGGDNLVAINSWCKKKGIKLAVIGIDIKEECIDYAKSRQHVFSSIRWVTNDYLKVVFQEKPDIIFSSLFCHHFTNSQLVIQFEWMKENSRVGFFINDLERSPVAYHCIKLLTQLFSKSYLVKNDAPLSVARGFTKKELLGISREANIENVNISWKWAFRYLLLLKND